MNQNILQYYILGGTIWRKRRQARARAAAAEEMKKEESVQPVTSVSRRRILQEDGRNQSRT